MQFCIDELIDTDEKIALPTPLTGPFDAEQVLRNMSASMARSCGSCLRTRWPYPNELERALVCSSAIPDPSQGFITLRRSYNTGSNEHPEMVLFPFPRVVFLDVDGVMANAVDINELVVQEFLAGYGIDISIHELRQISLEGDLENAMNRELFSYASRQVQKQFSIPTNRLEEEIREIERTRYEDARNTSLVSVKEIAILRRLLPVCLATNRDEDDAIRFLAQNGFAELFTKRIGRNLTEQSTIYAHSIAKGIKRKPNPDMLIQGMLELGIDSGPVFMVGDSDTDLGLLARNANEYGIEVYCVGVLRPGQGRNLRAEEKLFAAGAAVVVPNLSFFIKDICRAFDMAYGRTKHLPNYRRAKKEIDTHKLEISRMQGNGE